MQVLVAGMHRSGTSVVTRLLNAAGFHVGAEKEMMPAMPDNPAGYWERMDFFKLNTMALEKAGVAWDTTQGDEVKTLGPALRNEIVGNFRDAVQELEKHRPWAVKDPRFSVLLPLWKPLLADPVVVICHRNPVEVATSLLGRDGMPMSIGVALWEVYNLAVIQNTRNVPRLFVAHQDLMKSPVSTVKALVAELIELGAPSIKPPTAGEIKKIIDPKLYRSKSTTDQVADLIGMRQRLLLEAIEEGNNLDDFGIDGLTPSSKELITFYRETTQDGVDRSADDEGEVSRLFKLIESERTNLAEDLRDLHEAKAELGVRFDHANQERAELGAKLESTKKENRELTDEVHRLDSLHRETAGRLEQAHHDLEAVGMMLEKQNENSGRLASDLISANSEKGELGSRFDRVNQENAEYSAKLESMKSEMRDLRDEVHRLDSLQNETVGRLEQAHHDLETVGTMLEKQNKNSDRLASDLISANSEKGELGVRFDRVNKENAEYSAKLESTKSETRDLRDEVHRLDSLQKETVGRLEQAHHDLEAVGTMLEKQNERSDRLASDLIAVHGEKRELGKTLEERVDVNNGLATRLEEIASERDQLRGALTDLTAQRDELQGGLKQANHDLANIGRLLESMNASKDELAEELIRTHAEKTAVGNQLEQRSIDFTEEIELLKNSLSTNEREVIELCRDRNAARERLETVENELRSIQESRLWRLWAVISGKQPS
jgi:chromosome segregation ATPase